MSKPTKAQRSILVRLAAGERVCWSWHGGWRFAGHGYVRTGTAKAIRDRGWIAAESSNPLFDSAVFYMLTAAGRAALDGAS